MTRISIEEARKNAERAARHGFRSGSFELSSIPHINEQYQGKIRSVSCDNESLIVSLYWLRTDTMVAPRWLWQKIRSTPPIRIPYREMFVFVYDKGEAVIQRFHINPPKGCSMDDWLILRSSFRHERYMRTKPREWAGATGPIMPLDIQNALACIKHYRP